jgi:putative phage-type endonuclease
MTRKHWLAERQKGIGGSDASCILGLNPYRTNVQLWEEKTGRTIAEDISEKPCVKYGTQAEQHLRELFKLDYPQFDVGYEEFKIYKNAEYPFIIATLDANLIERETGKKGILEVKTTEILRSMQREKWNEKMPDNYYIQCLHQLLATDWEFNILKAQLKSEWQGDIRLTTKHYRINRDEVLEDIEILKQAEIKFWFYVVTDTKPPLILPNI